MDWHELWILNLTANKARLQYVTIAIVTVFCEQKTHLLASSLATGIRRWFAILLEKIFTFSCKTPFFSKWRHSNGSDVTGWRHIGVTSYDYDVIWIIPRSWHYKEITALTRLQSYQSMKTTSPSTHQEWSGNYACFWESMRTSATK